MRLSKLALTESASTLGVVIWWAWMTSGNVVFLCTAGNAALTATSGRTFQPVCLALVYNNPMLLRSPRVYDEFIPYDVKIRIHHV